MYSYLSLQKSKNNNNNNNNNKCKLELNKLNECLQKSKLFNNSVIIDEFSNDHLIVSNIDLKCDKLFNDFIKCDETIEYVRIIKNSSK